MHKEIIEPTQFLGENNQYHFVYRTHNLINQKEYTGKHSTDDLNDGYFGSGLGINAAVKKYGIENFAVEILSFHKTSDHAYFEEWKIVNYDYIEEHYTYNECTGGSGSGPWQVNNTGMTVVKDKSGNTMQVSVDDPRYLNGELVGIMLNKNIKHTLKICPYCNKEGRGPNMTSYHFDNCKENPNRIIINCTYCNKSGSIATISF